MSLKRWIKRGANHFLRLAGQELVGTGAVYEWQRNVVYRPCRNKCTLTEGALQYLRPDNSKLIDLQQKYSVCAPDVITPSVWKDSHLRAEDIAYFRGDSAWVWQLRGQGTNILAYAISFYYLKSMDRLGLFDRLAERMRASEISPT